MISAIIIDIWIIDITKLVYPQLIILGYDTEKAAVVLSEISSVEKLALPAILIKPGSVGPYI